MWCIMWMKRKNNFLKGSSKQAVALRRCCFLKSSLKNIATFQLVGYSVWNGEAAGSSPACYTSLVCSSKGLGCQAFYLTMPVRIWHRLHWFVGVRVNMVDCLSIVMRSIRVRTAKLLGGAMASISAFDVEDVGSSPAPITNVGFSLFGKVSHCECAEQGSNPEVNQ